MDRLLAFGRAGRMGVVAQGARQVDPGGPPGQAVHPVPGCRCPCPLGFHFSLAPVPWGRVFLVPGVQLPPAPVPALVLAILLAQQVLEEPRVQALGLSVPL